MSFKNSLARLCFLSLILCLITVTPSSTSEQYDLLIRNTKIVDGTGKVAFKGDLAIKGEKIVAMGNVKGNAATVIDGSGLVTCPGFIDTHSHADRTIIYYPKAENLIMQGITTFLGGNCGESPAPQKNLTFCAFLSQLEKVGLSINFAPLVGHNTIRTAVMGNDFKRQARPEEIEQMKKLVDEAIGSGAFGLSTFTDPSPGEYASLEEIIELVKVVQKQGAFYVPHTRHCQSQMPSDRLEEYGYGIYHGPIEDVWVGKYRGFHEALDICRKTNCRLHLAHLNTIYKFPQPHPEFLDEAGARATLVEIVDRALKEGLDISFDTIASPLTIKGPRPLITDFYGGRNVAMEWTKELTRDEFIEKLKMREFRDKLRSVYEAHRLKIEMVHTREDPYWMDCFTILKCKNKEYEGKTLGEITRSRNADAIETIFDILLEDPDTIWIQSLDKRFMPGQVRVFLQHPMAIPCTDVIAYPANPLEDKVTPYKSIGTFLPPAIAYGLYAYYIGTYVREEGILTLEEAIKKATSMPAQRFGFVDRGILGVDAYADIVIFDLGTIKIAGDYMHPNLPPEGIKYVLINGKVVYKNKVHTGEKSGKVLRYK